MFDRANTPAYLPRASVSATKSKSFMTLTLAANVLKPFFICPPTQRLNKSSRPILILLGKTKSLLQERALRLGSKCQAKANTRAHLRKATVSQTKSKGFITLPTVPML
jgi:hypothetical protein